MTHETFTEREAEREEAREEEERESEIGLPVDSLGRNRLTGCVVYDCAKHARTHTDAVSESNRRGCSGSLVESRAARFLRRNLLDSLSCCWMVNEVRRCLRDSECYF